jgi:hypothetical protein
MSVEPQQGLVSQAQICPNPIFIIGAPRSGTSILAWSLAQHSRLWTSGETYVLSYLFEEDWINRTFQRARQMPASLFATQGVEQDEFLRFLGVGLNALFSSKSQGKRWIDQTPAYTLLVDTLVGMFPGAFFLHILRDGRRTVHSMTNFHKKLSKEQRTAIFKSGNPVGWPDFRQACQTWREFVEIAMDFCSRHPTRCLTVVNEEMVADPHKSFREILEFLDAPYEDAPADYFRSNRINSSFRPDSNDPNWARQLSEPWKQWTPDQAAIFGLEAGETMIKYGLVKEPDMHSRNVATIGQEQRRLRQAHIELERWAHELEAAVRRQEMIIKTYQHRLALVALLLDVLKRLRWPPGR